MIARTTHTLIFPLIALSSLSACTDTLFGCTERLDKLVVRFAVVFPEARIAETEATRTAISDTLTQCSRLPLESVFSDASLRDEDGKAFTLLDLAVIADDAELVRHYLGAGVPIYGFAFMPHHAYTGGSSLHVAARSASLSAAAVLLEAGAEVAATDDLGQTPLMFSAGYTDDWLDLTQLLIDHGAEIDQRDSEGRSALSLAVWRGDLAAVRLLLANGASAGPLPDGTTLRELALQRRQEEIANLLHESSSQPSQ